MASTIHTSGELKARMTNLESTLRSSSRGASTGATAMLVVGVVALTAFSGFFYYGYSQFSFFLGEKDTVKNILDFGEGQFDANMVVAREYLETTIKENAGAWAQAASDSIVEGAPSAREQAVAMAASAFEQSMEESNKHAEAMIAAYLEKNRDKIKMAVQKFSGTPQEADQFLADLKDDFSDQVALDMDEGIKQVSDFIEGFTGVLAKTKSDSVRMSQLQAMQREILMLFKRALLEHAPAPNVANR